MKIVVDRLVSSSGSPAPADVTSAAAAPAAARAMAVVVSYEPDRDALMRQVESICAIAPVVIVDNSESEAGAASALAVAAAYDCHFVANPRNLGVAEAQNLGLRVAQQEGCAYALLLDQDSVLEPDALPALVRQMESLKHAGERVAAVGASYVDPRNGMRYPFARLSGMRMNMVWPQDGGTAECDMLISSGCLICLDALADIGLMDPSLFIDYVDFEWCRRAVSRGYKVFAVADARMHHTIGDQSFRALGRTFNLHSPVRQYYFIRNALLFMRRPYLNLHWRVHLAYRVLGQLALFGVFAPNRVQRLGWMLRGLFDGLIGREGRLGGPDGLHAMRPPRFDRPASYEPLRRSERPALPGENEVSLAD